VLVATVLVTTGCGSYRAHKGDDGKRVPHVSSVDDELDNDRMVDRQSVYI
jgi:hypothetical protein